MRRNLVSRRIDERDARWLSPASRSPRETANGRWRAFVDVGADAAGRRLRKKVSGRTRSEALLRLREVQRDAEDGLASGGRHLTIAALADAGPIEAMRTRAATSRRGTSPKRPSRPAPTAFWDAARAAVLLNHVRSRPVSPQPLVWYR